MFLKVLLDLFFRIFPSMPDPYLEAMMRGDYLPHKNLKKVDVPKKNKFDVAAEKHIDNYIRSLNLEVEYVQNKLVSQKEKYAQIKQEMLNDLKLTELESYLSTSVKFLIAKGHIYQSAELQQEMLDQFKQADEILNKIDLSIETNEKTQNVLKLSDSVINSTFHIAIALFVEEDYLNSLALFVLLSILDSENYDYWYRLGIAAQKSENYGLALKSYAASLELNPKNIGARLFSVECYLRQEDLNTAKLQLSAVKKIKETEVLETEWIDFINNIESLINN